MQTIEKYSERDELKMKENKIAAEQNINQPQIINNQIGIMDNTANPPVNLQENPPVNLQGNPPVNLQENPQINPQLNPVPIQPPQVLPLVVNPDLQGYAPIIKPKQFGSKPIGTYCPNCRFPITTNSSRKCNCCSCCWCWCCFYLWIFIQCCRKKEITCFDYEHTCPRCGFVLGSYDAW